MTTEEVLIAVVPYWRHLSSVGDAAGVVIGCPAISVIRCCFVLTTPSAPVTRKSSVVYLPHSSAFPAHCAACRASTAFLRVGSDCPKPRMGRTAARHRAIARRLIVKLMGPLLRLRVTGSPDFGCSKYVTGHRLSSLGGWAATGVRYGVPLYETYALALVVYC